MVREIKIESLKFEDEAKELTDSEPMKPYVAAHGAILWGEAAENAARRLIAPLALQDRVPHPSEAGRHIVIETLKFDPRIRDVDLGSERMIKSGKENSAKAMAKVTLSEVGSGYDADAHADRAETTASRVASLLRRAKHRLIQECAKQAVRSDITVGSTIARHFDAELAADIEYALGTAFRFGANQVYAERYRQIGRGRKIPPQALRGATLAGASSGVPCGGELSKALADRIIDGQVLATTAVADLNDWINSRVAAAAVDLRKDGLVGDALETGILAAVDSAPKGFIDRIADRAARKAVFGGRVQSLRELDNQVKRYVRVEGNYGTPLICDTCHDHHLDEWPDLASVNWTRGSDCEAGDLCCGDLWADFIHGVG